MPRTKKLKYERVQALSNVTFFAPDETGRPDTYPWHAACYKGMGIVLELGCGKGEYTLAFAAADPGRMYIGVDRKSPRLCLGAEAAIAAELSNVRFLRAPIERLRLFFRTCSIDEIWLTFPDPYPKTRSVKSRLTAPAFLDVYASLLKPGGRVHLKTDNTLLFDYSLSSVEAWGGRLIVQADDCHEVDWDGTFIRTAVSAYEQAACAKGKTIKYASFQLGG